MTVTDHLTPDERALAERVAAESSRTFARFWWSECRRIEEQVSDPRARWEILLRALRLIGRRTR